MQPEIFRATILHLTSSDAVQREAACDTFLAEDEEAVNPLIAEFHAGVSEALGVAIINLVGEIGGPDALTLLRYVYHFEEKHLEWHKAAREALLYNQCNLDSDELAALEDDDAPDAG